MVAAALERPTLSTVIRGQQYRAERFTKTSYIALSSLIIEKGREFPDLDNDNEKQQLAELLLERLSDDQYIKKLTYWLLFIFPSLPPNLVWYDEEEKRPSFGLTLELEEIIQIVSNCTNALNLKPDRPKPSNNGFSSLPKRR